MVKNNKERRLKDALILLRQSFTIFKEIDSDDAVLVQLSKIFQKYEKKWKKSSYGISDVRLLVEYLEVINNFNKSDILKSGRKLLRK
jgi:hypothetical protein